LSAAASSGDCACLVFCLSVLLGGGEEDINTLFYCESLSFLPYKTCVGVAGLKPMAVVVYVGCGGGRLKTAVGNHYVGFAFDEGEDDFACVVCGCINSNDGEYGDDDDDDGYRQQHCLAASRYIVFGAPEEWRKRSRERYKQPFLLHNSLLSTQVHLCSGTKNLNHIRFMCGTEVLV